MDSFDTAASGTFPVSMRLLLALIGAGLSALSSQHLSLSTTNLSLGLGQISRVAISGGGPAPSVESSDEQVAAATREGSSAIVRAVGPGRAIVSVSAGGETKAISVVVRTAAMAFPQSIRAEVSGAPASKETVLGAIQTAIHTRLVVQPGTEISLVHAQTTEVRPGDSQTFVARVSATSAEGTRSEGQVFVSVRNIALPAKEESTLWYCNNPESVKKLGALFSSQLEAEQPVRLLYHHENDSRSVFVLKVQVVNESDLPGRIEVIPGDSPPDANPVRAGFRAATQFMRGWKQGSGEIVSIPPHRTLPISLRRLWPGQTASGLCSLRLLEGGPEKMLVRVDARAPFALDATWRAATKSPTPWRIVGHQPINEFDAPARTLTDQIYPNPYQFIDASYEVGGRFAFIRLGQNSIVRQDRRDRLDGNFGVVYKIRSTVANPTSRPATVEVVFEASAGYGGALGIWDGRFLATPLLSPKQEAPLARIKLNPGEKRTFLFTTLPFSGGSYPSTIAIRPYGTGVRYSQAVGSRIRTDQADLE